MLLAVVASCNWGDQVGSRVSLTPEQIRLEHVNTIDSTTLNTILNPDSVEGADTLASLSADAWMLIDDATGMVISQKYANEPPASPMMSSSAVTPECAWARAICWEISSTR